MLVVLNLLSVCKDEKIAMRYEWMLYYTILSVMILTFFIFSLIGTCMLLLVCQEVIVYLLYVIRSHRIILILRISAYLCCAYVQVLAGSIWSTQGAPMRNRSRNNHKAQDWAMATSLFDMNSWEVPDMKKWNTKENTLSGGETIVWKKFEVWIYLSWVP